MRVSDSERETVRERSERLHRVVPVWEGVGGSLSAYLAVLDRKAADEDKEIALHHSLGVGREAVWVTVGRTTASARMRHAPA